MTAFADESIDLTTATVATLTAATFRATGAASASRATVENVGTTPVLVRFGSAPVVSPQQGHKIAAGASLTIESFDDLVQAIFLLASGSSGRLFVTYRR